MYTEARDCDDSDRATGRFVQQVTAHASEDGRSGDVPLTNQPREVLLKALRGGAESW